MSEDKKYITLKEAAALSGYSPDYIGQLIRSGKLRGKQIYSNIAWVTTEEDLTQYMRVRKNSGGVGRSESISDATLQTRNRLYLFFQSPEVIKGIMYVALTVCGLFLIIFFYIASVTVEKHLHEKALREAESGIIK